MTSNLPGDPAAFFRPEFINRIDDIVRFRSLTKDDLLPIVDIQLRGLERRLADRQVTLEVTAAARSLLADLGYDESFGARPLKRTLQNQVADRLAVLVLDGTVGENDVITVDAPDGQLSFATRSGADT